jgi:hypothetical protein
VTTPIGYSVAISGHAGIDVSIGRSYRTKKSFVAVHFDPVGKGEIVFVPEGVTLRITGPSSCLREGFEVALGEQRYNVFAVDLFARCCRMLEPMRARSRATAA